MLSILASASLLLSPAPQDGPQVPDLAPFGPVPGESQLRWHDRTFYAFVHFGPNTFTGVEWGEGREDPNVFQPTELDARQWARAFKSAGMTGVIITAKHHDGFCLWPSDETEYDVAASTWLEGKGDVLARLSEACAGEGLWFGVYLSPWDRHEPRYGTGKGYDDHFVAQLTEALTRYGRVDEVWFDGANGEGPNGKRQVYDWPRYVATVREYQPGAVIFSDAGPDVRWCGNERAIGGETMWATLNRAEITIGTGKTDELNSGHRGGTHWIPAECNTSIRPGWFWKAGLDERVKTVEELNEIWYASVGRGGNFLLNVPPDARGLLPDVDVQRLGELGRLIERTHRRDVLAEKVRRGGVTHAASSVRGGPAGDARFDPSGMLSAGRGTFWAVDEGHDAEGHGLAWVEFRFPDPATFDEVWLEEPIQLGQRVERFHVMTQSDDGAWSRVAAGTTIGARRILRTAPVTTRRIRVVVDDALATPALSRLSLYLSPPRVTIDPPGTLSIAPVPVTLDARPGCQVRYTLDGSEVTLDAPLYTEPLRLAASATLRARAFDAEGPAPLEAVETYTIVAEADWRQALQLLVSPSPGLVLRQYEGSWQTLDQLEGREPVATREATNFDVSLASRAEMCALSFEGFIEVPVDGLFTFSLSSDDGSRLFVHDELVVDNDGLHGMAERSGRIALRAGFHPIRVVWFNARGAAGLEVRWSGPGVGRSTPIPANALFH